MDAFLGWWNRLHGWFLGTTEGAITLALIGNALFFILLRMLLKVPGVGIRLAKVWGEKYGRDSAPAMVMPDPKVALLWVGLKVATSTLYAIATLAFAYLLGPVFVSAGGVWWWLLSAVVAYGVFKAVGGIVALRVSYELVNGVRGGRIKQVWTKAMLDAAADLGKGPDDLREVGIIVPPGEPGKRPPEKPPEKPLGR